jgi:hypothetical protein
MVKNIDPFYISISSPGITQTYIQFTSIMVSLLELEPLCHTNIAINTR